MGADFSAIALIGFSIPYSALFRETKVRGCAHDETDAKFCSECAKPMWEEGKEPITGFDGDAQLGEWKVVFPPHYERDAVETVYIGESVRADSDMQTIGMNASNEKIETLRESLKAYLSDLGLLTRCEFGIWAILGVSF